MGVIGSKPQLERRNTILKRSQRSEIHKIKRRVEEKAKEICSSNIDRKRLFELKNELDTLHRKLSSKQNGLHPSCNYIFNETMAFVKEWQQNVTSMIQNKPIQRDEDVKSEDDEMEPVEIEENPPQSLQVAPITFQLGVPPTRAQVTQEESSDDDLPQVRNGERAGSGGATTRAEVYTNRQSGILKMGVPVMPESIIDTVDRRTQVFEVVQEKCSEKIEEIRSRIEDIEMEINDFVGRKGGEEYLRLRNELDGYQNELNSIHTDEDEELLEQIGHCTRYIQSCYTFLDEKTIKDFSSSSSNLLKNNNNVFSYPDVGGPDKTKTTMV